MSHNAGPQFRRTPGSVILTAVFLGIAAFLSLVGADVLLESILPLSVFFLVCGFINGGLAMGIIAHRRWAPAAAAVWSGLMILFFIVARMGVETPSSSVGMMLLSYILVCIFATRENTRKWCGVPGKRKPGFRSTDRKTEEERALTRHDQVELIGDVDEYGLRAGSVGTIIAVHDNPISFDVEFLDDRTWTAELVTLRPDQLRPVAKPR